MKKINHFFDTAHWILVYLAILPVMFVATVLIFALLEKLIMLENSIDLILIMKTSGVLSLVTSLMFTLMNSLAIKMKKSHEITDEFKKRAHKVDNIDEAEELWEEVKDFWKNNKDGGPQPIKDIKLIIDTKYKHFKSEEEKFETIDMTLNVDNLRKSEKSILELLGNPWSDEGMKKTLNEKLIKVRNKIEELEK